MSVHVSKIGLFNVNQNNERIDKNIATINDMKNSRLESLIIQDDKINTNGYPTLKEYLELEANDGFILLHLSQALVITSDDVSL